MTADFFISSSDWSLIEESAKTESSTTVAHNISGERASSSSRSIAEVLETHRRTIYNVARRILKDDSEAEDLVQEVWLLVHQRAHLFDSSKSSPVSWIIQMAYHRAIDRRRYLTHRQHYNRSEFVENLTPSRRSISLDAITARRLLEKLRQELSTEQMKTIELHFFEGLSFKEIAEQTGQSYGNVRNHYYRGIERLRAHIFPQKQR
jgi:RNA polymerase sigma-70 factor, ECF subfamily